MKKKISVFAIIFLLGISLIFASGSGESKSIRLKVGFPEGLENPIGIMCQEFKKIVEEKTNGEITVDLFPSSQLGGIREMLEATRIGNQEIVICTTGWVSSFVPQMSVLSFPYLFPEKEVAYDLIDGECTFDEAIKPTIVENLFIIPSTVDLAGAEVELIQIPQREKVVKKLLDEIKDSYDFILIDCPPSLGLITVNALTASDSVIIPMQCEFYAMEGITQLMNTIRLIKYHLNPNIDIEGVVMTMKEKRFNLTNQVSNEIIKVFNKKVYVTTIPRNVRLAEAPSHGLPVALYDSNSKGAEAYLSLAEEILKRSGTPYKKISKKRKF